jgi:hypothetical protein
LFSQDASGPDIPIALKWLNEAWLQMCNQCLIVFATKFTSGSVHAIYGNVQKAIYDDKPLDDQIF